MEKRPIPIPAGQRPNPLLDVPIDQLHGGMGIHLPQPPTQPEAAQDDGQPDRARQIGELLSDSELVGRCEELLKKYKAGKTHLESRIIENERWYRQRHSETASRNPGDPEPASAWLFNALANKHADAMDSIPSLAVMPREASDQSGAELLSSALPVVLEQNGFEQVYNDMWWYKLRTGTGVYGVFWDSGKLNGLGDISVRSLDLLNLFWEPGITDIQRSRNVFYVSLRDAEELRSQYPEQLGDSETRAYGAGAISLGEYVHDESIDKSTKVLLIDWYYKKRMPSGDVLHYAKICEGKVLFRSDTDPAYSQGFYAHGKYPFVLDALFPVPESPAGFGYIDICKGAQLYIDKLDSALLKNTIMGARPRFWKKGDGKVNVSQYADQLQDFVEFNGSGNPNDSIVQIPVPQLNPNALNMRTAKIEELKEVSGNRDFSQGATTGGVTAFSAIQALREAGSKLSRDMIASAYRAFAQVGYLCIDLMRQFYTEPRTFRITGRSGSLQFSQISAQQVGMRATGDSFMEAVHLPIYDIKVHAQKSDPFSSAVQNERAQALYHMGVFNPQMAAQAMPMLEMMDFEGRDKVMETVRRNGTLMQQMQQIGQLAMAMANQLDTMSGMPKYGPQIAQILQQTGLAAPASPEQGGVQQ